MQVTENDKVRTFESHDEMVDWLRASREALRKRPIAPAQQTIGWGDRAVRFMDSTVVFAHVVTRDSITSEPREIQEQMINNAVDGLLYAACYSAEYPDLDYGSVHRSVLWPIDERTFEAGRRARWNLSNMPPSAVNSLRVAYEAFTAHLRTYVGGEV